MHRLISLVLLVAVVLGLAETSASAADGDSNEILQVSRDGQTWSSSLTDPLFDPALRWVPGDVRTQTFFVRNNRPDSGRLQIVVDRAVDDALRETEFLQISARVRDGEWVAISAPGRHVLVDDARLRGASETSVSVRVRFLPEAPNDTMQLPTDLGFRAILTDATAVLGEDDEAGFPAVGDSGSGAGASGASGSSGAFGASGASGSAGSGVDGSNGFAADGSQLAGAGGDLPGTGSMVPGWATPLALLLLLTGGVLLARRREPEEAPRG